MIDPKHNVENKFVCNLCSRDMRVPFELFGKGQPPLSYPDGFVYGLLAEVSTGYFTYAREGYETDLKDGDNVRFKMCEPCLSTLFKTFQIPPEKESYF